jgi:hypothetical protein
MTQSSSEGKAGSISESIGHKVSVSPLLPGVAVSLNAQPYGGYQVVVFSSVGNEPSELYAGLRAVGFASREQSVPVVGSTRQSFGRHGSGLLGGWTGPERERFLAEARRTLRRFGFAFVPEVAYMHGGSQ